MHRLSAVRPHWILLAVLSGATLLLGACNLDDEMAGWRDKDAVDRPQKLSRDDYRNINRADKIMEGQANVEMGVPPIPDVAQIIAAPRPPKVGNTKLVSIAVTDDVPLRDVLFELGRLADVDIEIGPGLSDRGVNFRAKDKPFNEVIERISDLAGLRYKVSNGALRVEADTPYFKNYAIDFLNIERSSSSSMNVSSNVLSATVGTSSGGSESSSGSSSGGSSGGSGGQSVTSGTTSSISASAQGDLWSALGSSIGEILGSSGAAGSSLATDSFNGGSGGAAGATGASGTASGGGAAAAGSGSSFVINRQAGVLSVNGTERQHDRIAMFLAMLERNSSAQVLIEAKIVEVTLNDQFQSGINWTNLIGSLGSSNINLGNYDPGTGINAFSFANNGAVTFTLENGNLDAVLQMTQRFGTTRTLSSPRLHAINNQQAVLTFAQNRVVQICDLAESASATTNDTSTTSTGPSVDCTVSTLPIGIVLNILPSINLDTQEVTLNVRPTLSRQVDQVESVGTRIAARAIGDTTLQSFIPVVEVREIDSVMKVRSGAVMIIGGLMEDTATNEERGVPVVSEIPWLGNAFKSRNELSQKRELIIFIKATVVNSAGSVAPIDRGIYQKYTTDPRPI